ncbi:CLUMA_CG011524, isoform B [Clunio marinus]|uniref:CLUMA_CG011524, isoform B n=1 Tax=Clunio marinus TaxID=568069 RepID=A0A1J1IGI6_9DIPT|nr:CLUMA_CG011524, isoform B [Clunio marinus]
MKPQWTGISLAVQNQKRCGRDLELCCPRKGFMCGKTYPPVRRGPKADTRKGEAQYGGHPWHVAILNNDNSYLGAGVLIDHTNVLTAAHKIDNIAYASKLSLTNAKLLSLPLKVRLGEWDAANDAEPYKPIEIPIEKISK